MKLLPATYNKYFDDDSNQAIDDLVKSSKFINAQPRINRKNGSSKLDAFYPFIQEKLSANKTQGQIIGVLKTKFGLDISKSAMSRFISKKFGVINEEDK